MRRFYAPPERFQDDTVMLDPDETRHLARVLRLGVGDLVEVCDGQGRSVEARLTGLDPKGAHLRILRDLAFWGESPLVLVLGIGLAKGEALEGVVRQATEMGVQRIIPFVSERSERVTPERGRRRRERWQRLTREMIKSCQRSLLPEIEAVQEFSGVLAGSEAVKLIFWEEERGGGLQSLLAQPRPGTVRLLIGPEGGFSAAEVDQARAAGFAIASLGPRRLKVETAALAALSLLQHAWGDLA
ncbi:MAG: 16S rRNA (uracil(1498)-N(3))-methyltransferase [Deltaproteobacteria bacterium]|nr:16S rRNA (uracil(1498)-N(3))-methyltransferase [Deltaproteobacteria bacterium]